MNALKDEDKRSMDHKDIFIIRHASTASNMRGETPAIGEPINLRGAVRSLVMGWRMRNENYEIVITSELRRAKQTGSILAGSWGVPIESSPLFNERVFRTERNDAGWESLESLENRCHSLRELLMNQKENRLVVVSHATLTKAWLRMIQEPKHWQATFEPYNKRWGMAHFGVIHLRLHPGAPDEIISINPTFFEK